MGEAQATATYVASRLGAFTVWDLRSTDGGASGLAFARASLDPSRSILVHAPPSRLDVEVRSNGEHLIAVGHDLRADPGEATPIARLVLDGTRVLRSQIWPTERDLGSVVLLPGGEAGVLRSWETSPDRSAWTWSLELQGGVVKERDGDDHPDA
jgi:hypothetical protein